MWKHILCLLLFLIDLMPVNVYADNILDKFSSEYVQGSDSCNKTKLEIELDKNLEVCMKKYNETQAGMNHCMATHYEDWDKALNDVYSAVMKKLDNKGKATLRESQREWIKFRDSHSKLLKSYYDKLQGSMYPGMQMSDEIGVIRNRVFELYGIVGLIDLGKGNP